MGGWTFLHPAWLAGLALLGVPVMLHLMNRQLPRRLVFPAVRFILKASEPQRGRRSLRDWFTLLARLLLLALAVLLLAGPQRASAPPAGQVGGEELLVFVDLSASMQVRDLATELPAAVAPLLAQHPHARLALVASSDQVVKQLPLGTPAEVLLRTLGELRASARPGHHDDAWRLLPHLFSDAPGVPRTVLLASDLQRSDWAAFPALARHLPATFVPLWPPVETPNTEIAGVSSELLSRGDQRRLRAVVWVRHHGPRPASAELRLQAGDRRVERHLELPAEASERVVVELEDPLGQEGIATIRSGDPYSLDDSWHFWLGPRPAIHVAAVLGDPKQQGLELLFLQQALSANLPGVDQVVVKAFGPEFMAEQNPHLFDAVIFLDAIGNYTDFELAPLREYLEGGGQVILFAGPHSADCLATLNRGQLASTRYLGLQGPTAETSVHTVTAMQRGVPLLATFEREPSDLLLFPIYRFVRFAPGPGEVNVLQLAPDLPLLLQRPVGKGTISLFAVNLGATWSELPTAQAFVPLMRRLVTADLGDSTRGILAAEVGEDLAARVAAWSDDAAPPAAIPDQPGVTILAGHPVVRNYTRRESDLRPLDDLDWLAAPVVAGVPTTSSAAAAAPGGTGTGAGIPTAVSWRPALAWAILAFVLLELIVANWEKGSTPWRRPQQQPN